MVSSKLRGVLGIEIEASFAVGGLASCDFSSLELILMMGGRELEP